MHRTFTSTYFLDSFLADNIFEPRKKIYHKYLSTAASTHTQNFAQKSTNSKVAKKLRCCKNLKSVPLRPQNVLFFVQKKCMTQHIDCFWAN